MFALSTEVSFPFTRPRQPKAQPQDSVDLLLGVGHAVDGPPSASRAPTLLRPPEVKAPGELADDQEVEPLEHLGLERGRIDQLRIARDGAEVGEEAELLADAQQPVLGPGLSRGVVPLGAAHGAEEDRVGAPAHLERLVGQGRAEAIDGDPAHEPLAIGEAVAEQLADPVQDARALGRDLGADAVAAQDRDGEVHGAYPPTRQAARARRSMGEPADTTPRFAMRPSVDGGRPRSARPPAYLATVRP